MAKFYGKVGFLETVETDPIKIGNKISIVMDPYSRDNFSKIRYVKWLGNTLKVTNIDVKYPRLILSLGGVYNENYATGN